jgi:endonuclease/exonuclease/phosphatase family metal-dependent hydrolase
MNVTRFLVWLGLGLAAGCGGAPAAERGEPGAEVDPSEPGGAVAHASGLPARLKLVTWNLEWLHRRDGTGPNKRSEQDYARLRGYADRLGADVIAFQEVDGSEAAARVFDPARYQLHVAAQDDPQRTGFAVKKGVPMTVHADYRALDVGQVRVGADITVELASGPLRLLSVHLKSSCFDDPLDSPGHDCQKLAAQLPVLEAWIDARGREHVPAVVLGDFNRRLFARADEPFWRELDDADPPESDLWSPTDGPRATCWGGTYPAFIDHLVFNKPARTLVLPNSFEQQPYDVADRAYKHVLSDHCPLAVTLVLPGAVPREKAKLLRDAGAPAPEQRIKGNINGGRKLYHAPGCPGYASTVINEYQGERWFISVAEAERAGWSRAPNCP